MIAPLDQLLDRHPRSGRLAIASLLLAGGAFLLGLLLLIVVGDASTLLRAAAGVALLAAVGALTLGWRWALRTTAGEEALFLAVARASREPVGPVASLADADLRRLSEALDAIGARPVLTPAEPAPNAAITDLVGVFETAFQHLRDGDLTWRITTEVPAAAVLLRDHYNEAVVRLSSLVASVGQTASEINLQSGEIARASEDLAKRTETNAASLEQGSHALNLVDERLRETADKARQTAERATAALGEVHQGHHVAQDAVAAMERVQASAKGIAAVIGGLDKIAFQTRVLAMNAAIEASRAGDAGRGFSVVADLVNSLAMRAEEESKSARDQLGATQADIVTAVEAVQRMDGTFDGISSGMTEVDALLKAIAEDNQAQSGAISNASGVIRAMDSATQQNAATAEQAAAASRLLHGQVSGLISLSGQFRIDAEARRLAAAPAEASGPRPPQSSGLRPTEPSGPRPTEPSAKRPPAPERPSAKVVPLVKQAAAPTPRPPFPATSATPAAPKAMPARPRAAGGAVPALAPSSPPAARTAPAGAPAAAPAPGPARAPAAVAAAAAAVARKPIVSPPTHKAVSEQDDWQDF